MYPEYWRKKHTHAFWIVRKWLECMEDCGLMNLILYFDFLDMFNGAFFSLSLPITSLFILSSLFSTLFSPSPSYLSVSPFSPLSSAPLYNTPKSNSLLLSSLPLFFPLLQSPLLLSHFHPYSSLSFKSLFFLLLSHTTLLLQFLFLHFFGYHCIDYIIE